MRLLLDTHALIWLQEQPNRIRQTTRELITDLNNEIFVSSAVAWEIAIKFRSGRLLFDPEWLSDFDGRVQALGFSPLSISAAHGIAGAHLPGRHKDPFDRLLAGQAQVEGLTVVTSDPLIAAFGVPTVW